MNNQDFERLKALCEKEGFEINGHLFSNNSDPNNAVKTLYSISKKDEWKGVEFVECVKSSVSRFTEGKIYKVNPDGNGVDLCDFLIDNNYHPNGFVGSNREYFKPSTEQAYVEQLKKEAHRLFGEIKVGDRFDRVEIDEPNINRIGVCSYKDFRYFKEEDSLEFGGVIIYQDGKWATRVPERVKVEFLDASLDVYNGIEEWGFTFGVHNHEYGNKLSLKAGQFLAKQFEKYLNDENC